MDHPQTDGLAIASLTLGIISWCLGCCGGAIFPIFGLISVPISLVGVVLGGIAARRIQAEPMQRTGQPFAIAGLVLNVLLLLWVLVLAAMMAAGMGLFLLGGAQ